MMNNENTLVNTGVQLTKQVDDVNSTLNENTYNNSVIGKTYDLSSARGTNLIGILNDKIISRVTFADDRLFIDMRPKRLNKVPALLYEDITGVNIAMKLNLYKCFYLIASIVAAIVNPLFLIISVLVLWLGRDMKITITQRNGISAVIYAKTKAEAEAFKEDVRKVAKIQ